MNNQDTDYVAIISQNGDIEHKFEEAVNFVENKVINADGLTLAEVFQALVQMLNGDLELVKEVLAYANIMAKHGMKVAKESQLSRADVRRALEGKESVINRQDLIKKPPLPPAVKSIKKKGRGF
jgi:L-fucose mutarotase/ribose pyranase (RbsD/FucU family)